MICCSDFERTFPPPEYIDDFITLLAIKIFDSRLSREVLIGSNEGDQISTYIYIRVLPGHFDKSYSLKVASSSKSIRIPIRISCKERFKNKYFIKFTQNYNSRLR